MTARLRRLLRRRSLEPLYDGGPGDPEEPLDWIPGARYEVARTVLLYQRPDPASPELGRLLEGSSALLLALEPWAVPDGGEVLMAFLADTRHTSWVSGWADLGPLPDHSGGTEASPLVLRRLRGSWELGGRYRVKDPLVLRADSDLESLELSELSKGEEVLLLEVAPVIRDGDPRLRGRVRTDGGQYGWLTIELPGGPPLLDPLNLCSKAAAKRGFLARKAPAAGECEEAWEVGGKYRALTKAPLRRDAELNSPLVGTVKPGDLVTVQELRRVQWHPNADLSLRLRVDVDGGVGTSWSSGWMSTTGTSGESLLDTRDVLEYEKWVRSEAPVVRTVRLQRPPGLALGLVVDHADGRTLLVQEISEDGLLADWNSSQPAAQILPGDRITCVNGISGDSLALLEEMAADTLEVAFQRCASPSKSSEATATAERSGSFGGRGRWVPEPLVSEMEASRSHEGAASGSSSSPAQAVEGRRSGRLLASQRNARLRALQAAQEQAGVPHSSPPPVPPPSSDPPASASRERRRRPSPPSDESEDEWRPLEEELRALEDEERKLVEVEGAWSSVADLSWATTVQSPERQRRGGATSPRGGWSPGLTNGPTAASPLPRAALKDERHEAHGEDNDTGTVAAREAEREWRPVGVCVEEVPDWKLFGDQHPPDNEASDDCNCRPCRNSKGFDGGFLAALFSCGPGDPGKRKWSGTPLSPPGGAGTCTAPNGGCDMDSLASALLLPAPRAAAAAAAAGRGAPAPAKPQGLPGPGVPQQAAGWLQARAQ